MKTLDIGIFFHKIRKHFFDCVICVFDNRKIDKNLWKCYISHFTIYCFTITILRLPKRIHSKKEKKLIGSEISEGEKERKKDGKRKKKSLTHKSSQKKRLKIDRGDFRKNRENTMSTPYLPSIPILKNLSLYIFRKQ